MPLPTFTVILTFCSLLHPTNCQQQQPVFNPPPTSEIGCEVGSAIAAARIISELSPLPDKGDQWVIRKVRCVPIDPGGHKDGYAQ